MAQVDGREQIESIENIQFGDPPSPWLRRYCGVHDPKLRREGRSGLAPKFPTLAPFGVDVDYDAQPLPRPPAADLDSLLWDEATQLVENKGWKGWQLGAFAEGSIPEDNDGLIKVDDTKWHPMLRKERWYDLQVPLEPGNPDKGIMSIDNPLVWEDMSVVIELADRLFGMLVRDGFFDGLITGVPFSKVQCGTKSKGYTDRASEIDRTPKCARRADIMALSETDRKTVRDKVMPRTLGFAPLTVISWFQDRSPLDNKLPQYPPPSDPSHRRTPPWGATFMYVGQDKKRNVVIKLAASIFRAIRQCDETTQDGRAEKRMLIVSYAKTLVHEMAHAVYMLHKRCQDSECRETAVKNLRSQDEMVGMGFKTVAAANVAKQAIANLMDSQLLGNAEPAIEDDNVAELGYAAEQHLFGGAPHRLPYGASSAACMHTFMSTYQLYLCQFPGDAARFMNYRLHWDAESRWTFPRVDMTHAMPASYAVHLLSQVYWEKSCYGSTGMAALRPPKVFPSAGRMIHRNTSLQYYSNVFDQDIEQAMEARALGASFPGIKKDDDYEGRCQHVLDRLAARRALWNHRLRPWYQLERQRWTRTPYGHYHLRLNLRLFTHAVEIKDENEANTRARLVNFLARTMPPNRISDDVRAYYHVVSLAMFATLPWRTTQQKVDVKPDVKSWTTPNLWQPSMTARQWQAKPENQPFAFAFKPEIKAENAVESYSVGGIIPAPLSSMLPWKGRAGLLRQASETLKQLYQNRRLQDNVYKCTEDQLRRLTLEVTMNVMTYTGFLSSFSLDLPIYESVPVDQQVVPPANPGPPPAPVPPAQPSTQAVAGQPAGAGLFPAQGSFQGPPGAGPNAFMARVMEQQDLTKKYWSAGEVGDHGGRWVLMDNDELGGYDVFSVSTLPPRGALQLDFKYGVRVTDQSVAARIRAGEGTFQGRLLLPRGKEEIAENDGHHSGSKWVLAGPYIYDITHFPAKDDDEHDFLWSAPHGDVLHVVLQGSHHRDLDDLQSRLYPFRCATLRRPQPTSDRTLWRPYTMREVNLHVFPQIRAFTSVDGWVYDVTEFAETSPLGQHKLLSLAGREVGEHIRSTNLFPPEWTERFLRDVAPYRVGWVVPERSADDARLGPQEIQLRNHVYSFAVLVENPKTKQDADLGRALLSLGLGGTDATDQLAEYHELKQLTERPEFVVAMLYSEPAFEVTQEDLEAHVGVFSAQVAGEHEAEELDEEEDENVEKYHLDGSTWARIGDVVYDVSDLVQYGDDATRARVLAFAGGVITDASLIHDIQRCGLAPIIGKFVGKKPGIKRKWYSMLPKSTILPGFGHGLDLPPPELEEEVDCGCGLSQEEEEEEEEEDFLMGEDHLPPIDPEDLAAFSHMGMDEYRDGKRMRLV